MGCQSNCQQGDGVVYSHMGLHWGSNYSTKLRRTVHLGYRAFGGDSYPIVDHFYWNLGFTQHLPAKARTQFEHFFQLQQQQSDVIEATFHAICNKDADGFRDGVAKLHPGEEERMVAVVFLSKLADKIHKLKDPEISKLSIEERIGAISAHRLNFHLYEDFAGSFFHRRCRKYLETVFDAI